MVTKVKTKYLFSKVIDGYMLSLGARNLSQHTLDDYTRTLNKFATFLKEDLNIHEITHRDVEAFLASLAQLSNKSRLNHYIGLSALWTWLVNEEIVPENIVRKIKPPKPEKKEVIPFTEVEIKAIMSSLNRSKVYVRQGANVDHSLGSHERNRAIILLMLDTGVRASELCDLNIEDIDQKNHRIFVRKGKGMKERMLPFSPRTGQMIWRYLAARKETQPQDPLFVGRLNRPLNRTKLAEMFAGIGRRAGVSGFHPHRLRHTFAIQYLRNGGNAYTLQMMLGHSSLETVKIYLRLAQVDLDTTHRRASPVDNWRL
jgi:site-specific recombinase XerD